MDAKYLGESADGLEGGKSYPVEGFTGSMALVLNGEDKLVQIPYADLNDSDKWDLSQKKKRDNSDDKQKLSEKSDEDIVE